MKKIWLIILISVAVLFRFYHLTYSPPGLNWDEVSIGYNAYSILKTGKDEWGQFLPLSFKAFGEHKLPGMIYASIPGIALFGTTDFAVRVTPAIIGVIAVILMYLLSKKMFNSEISAYGAALLLAISPWAIHFSRVSFEAGLAMVLVMTSIYFLIDSKFGKQNLWLSMLFAVFATYTYNSIRILLPLMFIAYSFSGAIAWKKLKISKLITIIIIGIILLSPVITGLTKAEERVRWGTLSITGQKSFVDGIAESRGYTILPGALPRLIHNKATHFVYQLFINYINIYSTEFLFISGGSNTERSVQGVGLLYYFEFPLLLLGLFGLLKKNSQFGHLKNILLPWLLLAPIPSILTIDSPSTVRALNLLPALILIESIGIRDVVEWFKSHQILRSISIIFVIWNVSYFAYQLFFVYPVKYSDKWLYGYKQAVQYANKHYAEASKIYMTARFGEPYIYTLFYTGYEPSKFQTGPVQREVDPTGWVHVSGFDKYTFTIFTGLDEPTEIVARNSGRLIMIAGFTDLPGKYTRDLEIKAPNWKIMFEGTIQEGQQ